jgi:predicted DNA-binding protein YlxM (UPF0122 family)
MMHKPTPEALEAALSNMPRMLDTTKERMRRFFLEGATLPEIAASEQIRVEGLANATRRVREKLAQMERGSATRQIRSAVPVVLQIQPQDLERTFAAMPRITEATKDRLRRFFIEGQSAPEIAKADGISAEALHNAARRVRELLSSQINPWDGVAVQLVMPAALAEEMQALCLELMTATNRTRAEKVMQYTLDGLSIARAQLRRKANA